MSCPLLRRAHPAECRAVSAGPAPIGRDVVATYCRARHAECPAYRYVRAAGHGLHPADFRSWVVEGIRPGSVEPDPDHPYLQPGPDAG